MPLLAVFKNKDVTSEYIIGSGAQFLDVIYAGYLVKETLSTTNDEACTVSSCAALSLKMYGIQEKLKTRAGNWAAIG